MRVVDLDIGASKSDICAIRVAESMFPDGHAAPNRPLDGMFEIGGVEQDEGVAAEFRTA